MRTIAALFFLSSILFSSIAAQSKPSNASLLSVVESERAFAKKSLELGSRAAFMMFFADDAVVFRPHPVKYKEAMKNVAMPKNPLETTLEWEPIWADVSRNGDLGYTTGPSVWTDHTPANRPTYFGFYFSFWKKQPTGEWKVVFDVGTELPGPHSGSREFLSPAADERVANPPKLNPEEQRASLMDAEHKFLDSATKNGVQRALGEVLDKDARIYRQKSYPIVGIDSIRVYFSRRHYLSSWETMQCEVATSGDLGYSYGRYTAGNSRDQTAGGEKGYFLHAWRCDAASRWKLVAEITSPLSPETPKPKQ